MSAETEPISPSTLSPISQCSQEIIDKIIDCVAETSPVYLSQCVLVCRAFHSRSQYHIFRTLFVENEDLERRLKTVVDIIQRNPSVLSLVRELYLHIVEPEYDYDWIGEDPTFLDLMDQKKSSETKLSMLTLRSSSDSLSDRLSMNFHLIIDNLFRPFIYQFLTSLTLGNVDLNCTPIEIFAECARLVELELDNVGFTGASLEATRELVKPTIYQLSHCMSRPPLSGNGSHKGWDECLNFSKLKCLEIYKCGLPDLTFEQKLVDLAGASLQVLRIMSRDELSMLISVEDPGFRNCNHFINLQATVSLSTLHTAILFPEEKLDPFTRTLSQIPEANKLTEINVVVYIGVYETAEPNFLLDADWTTFCRELVRITKSHPVYFRSKMIYIHHDDTYRKHFPEEPRLHRQCKLALATLCTEFFYPLAGDCQCIITATYEFKVALGDPC